ncbi:MAG TPA: hypothetical protein VNL70_05320 [Tepidisphaeraceae bacterium]|nr:hypothetical protein [Tepidisphaeraceae bacterium]
MSRNPVIAVVGSGRDDSPAVPVAAQLGRLIAEQGWVLLSGGRNAGVMRAVNEGAKRAGGLTVGLLPHRSSEVAPGVDVAIFTDLGNARNNLIVLSADVVVACGVEGPGTASEVALAIKNGTPLILLGVSETARLFFNSLGQGMIRWAQSPEQTIELIRQILDCGKQSHP